LQRLQERLPFGRGVGRKADHIDIQDRDMLDGALAIWENGDSLKYTRF
jgi:hypothetical protein